MGSPRQSLHTQARGVSPQSGHRFSVGTAATAAATGVSSRRGSGTAVTVVAPGGGTGCNAAAYSHLGHLPNLTVDIVGQSRAPYDRYPPGWPEGSPAPNLETFAEDLVARCVLENTDCLIVGSRGGQVVLPTFWRMRGASTPPAVVINGGCAMSGLPSKIIWPDTAVTFLVLGSRDYFKGDQSTAMYMADTRSSVPPANSTTAILLINEMEHMPDTDVLSGILPHLVKAAVAWGPSCDQASGRRIVRAELDDILCILVALGLSGRLHYTIGPGKWEEFVFDRHGVGRR